jgi:hypothetical protein
MDVEEEKAPRRPRPQYYFQIIAAPASEAPLEHRLALVGKVFPLLPRNMDGPEPMIALEVESQKPVAIADGICARMHEVVRVLRSAGEEEAAEYWAALHLDTIVFERAEIRMVGLAPPAE